MGKKNRNKKTSEQQGGAQGSQQQSQQRAPQSNGAPRNSPAQQQPQQRVARQTEAPQAQAAWSNVAGSTQRLPQERAAWPNVAGQNSPAQEQSTDDDSGWTTVGAQNSPARQQPQQRSAWGNAAGKNSPAQKQPQQRSAWGNPVGQSAPVQQAQPAQQQPQQRSAWGNPVGQSAPVQQAQPAQQPPQQKSAWGNPAGQSAPVQQAQPAQQQPQQKSGWGNPAGQSAPVQQAQPAQQQPQQKSGWGNPAGQSVPVQQAQPTQQQPQQKSAWGNPAGQSAPVQQAQPAQQQPQHKSAWGNAAGQSVSAQQVQPVEQALSQLSLERQPPATQAAAQQPPAEQAAGEHASAQKEERPGRRMEDEITTRPQTCATKHGTLGREVILQSNYFEVLRKTDWCLYQYRVDIAPEEERTFVKKALLKVHERVLGSYLFDGTMLFCANRLPSDKMELQTMRDDRTPMKITIKLTGDLARGDHHYLQLFNILVRKCLEHLDLQLVGRNYFDVAAKSVVKDFRLELWPGYVTSIRQHDKGILMCAEVSHKVMRLDTVYDIMQECWKDNRDYEGFKRAFESQILGIIVLTTYNNQTYRVDDIDWSANPNTTFERNKEPVSFAAYYNEKYQIRIRDMKQPLLISKMSQRQRRAGLSELAYLIPELCRPTGLTDKMRLNFRLMKALATHTKLSPETRIMKLMNFNNRLLSTPNVVNEFKKWDFQLNNRLVEVKGRILPTQEIYTGQNQLIRPKNCDWNFEMQAKAFYKGLPLSKWAIVVPNAVRDSAEIFVKTMIMSAKKMSFPMAQPKVQYITEDRADLLVDALEKLQKLDNYQLIMCILLNNNGLKYSAIKKKVCVDRPIPNQVVLARTLTQKSPSMLNAVTSKVAMQMGCKIGCVPWSVNVAQASRLNIMSVGFDVCHDKTKPGSDYGAMVASIDPTHGVYYSTVTSHTSGEELSNDLALKLTFACKAYKDKNRRLPDAIIIYRDGVGDGQIPFVYNYELKRVVQTLDKYFKAENQKLRLTFMIVTKRINTRLFNQRRNPDPGTVVDDVITDPLKYDFFLVSQSVREGTVSPTSYNIIYDSTGLSTDVMQQVTYKLCHMYFNFTGAVRVPAPCQFAHKLAFFVSQAVKQLPSTRLETLLYFI